MLNASKLRALVRVSIAMAVAFGLGWSGEQVAAVTTFTEIAISVAKDVWRSYFTQED